MSEARRFGSMEEVVCWLNAWGDSRAYPARQHQWREGYDQAMRDAMDAIQPLVGDWLPAWREGKWKKALKA